MKMAPIPIIRFDAEAATDAFAAYAELVKLEAVDPELLKSKSWWAVRRFAYRQFERAYEAPK